MSEVYIIPFIFLAVHSSLHSEEGASICKVSHMFTFSLIFEAGLIIRWSPCSIRVLVSCLRVVFGPVPGFLWPGHFVRMEENSPCKKITFSQPEGCWKKGRPKLRWLDSVLKYEKLLNVGAWWKKALNGNIWGRIIKEVKVQGFICLWFVP
jgi:hypothetical protein